MPCFCRVSCQNAVVLRFHKNILFSVNIIWSLLCEFNTKYLLFLCLCYQRPCALFWQNMWPGRHRMIVVGNHEFKQISSYISCRDFAVIFYCPYCYLHCIRKTKTHCRPAGRAGRTRRSRSAWLADLETVWKYKVYSYRVTLFNKKIVLLTSAWVYLCLNRLLVLM